MKRLRVLRLGAVAGSLATAATVLLHPRSGPSSRAAVKRGGQRVARKSANVAALIGDVAPRSRKPTPADGASRRAVEDALFAALGGAALPLHVVIDDGIVTVRGEVDRLSQIAGVSRVLEGFGGAAAGTVNLVRLSPKAGGHRAEG